MEPSLNSTPMDLLNATEDSSPCNSTPMNRAHALGVSVGEARDRRAFARVQRDCVGYMDSGVAKLGHTGARALATGGCAPPVQALLKIIGAECTVINHELDAKSAQRC